MTINQLEELWEKEYNRIQRELKKLAKQNEEIGTIPIPRKPKRVTEASVQRLKKIDTDYLKEKAKRLSKEISIQANHKVEESKPKRPRSKLEYESTRKGRINRAKGNGFVGVTDEQRKENLRKAREAQRKREAEDPEYAEAMRKKRAESLRKAREAQRKRESQNLAEKLTDEIKEEIRNDNEIDLQEINNKIDEDLSKIYVEDESTLIGIDTETGEIDDTTLDIIETINNQQDTSITEYEPDEDYSRTNGIIDSLKDLLENPATEMNKEYADVALRALDDIITYNELNGTLKEWLESIERTPADLISNAEVISQSSDAGEVQQSTTDFLIILYGSYSEIPESVLESADAVKNQFSYRAFSSSKFDMT